MNVLLLGATGYIGSVIAEKLQTAGHAVTGLARDATAVRRLTERGITSITADMNDTAAYADALDSADAVIYSALGNPTVLTDLANRLAQTGKTLMLMTGSMIYGPTPETPVTEDAPQNTPAPLAFLQASEAALLGAVSSQVRSIIIRAAWVYGRQGGDIPKLLLNTARQMGVASYIGTGENQWTTVHVDDLADLFVLTLQNAKPGDVFNAASQEQVSTKAVAEGIAGVLQQPIPQSITLEQAQPSWQFFAFPLSVNMLLSGAKAQTDLNWQPSQKSFMDELRAGEYR